jgi:hypothetical protein
MREFLNNDTTLATINNGEISNHDPPDDDGMTCAPLVSDEIFTGIKMFIFLLIEKCI